MTPRIQYRHLLRVAQRQKIAVGLPARSFPTKPTIIAPRYHQHHPFSTSLNNWQEARQSPVPEQPAAIVPPEPVDLSSTTATPPATTSTPPPPADPKQQEEPQQKKPSRLVQRLIFGLAFTLAGALGGSSLRLVLSPPDPPAPGTTEDGYTIRVLHEQAAKLPIVQQLSADADTWESWEAYESLPAAHRAQHITAGALAGSRGVGGYQRVWRNRRTGELLSVVFFGSATTGWPGVVHGGCLATILDESCGRAAFKDAQWGGRTGLTAKLTLEYKKVTMANGFYVVRVRVRGDEDLPERERGKRHYKCWVDAQVEDAVTGAVTVTAEALFVGGQGKKKVNNEGPLIEKGQHLRF
ncbi:HotDog domain-containing protein [Chaetomium sp. MPI-CAGE-AT-0009]|nr:HotDog domain-containing protein [Chaetomium sp. MPI-CAGE-AT-0009]